MTTPALAPVADIAEDVHEETLTAHEALALLRARGYTADAEALHDAVSALQLRDDFLLRCGNYETVGCLSFEDAVTEAELRFEDALRTLAVRRAEAAA